MAVVRGLQPRLRVRTWRGEPTVVGQRQIVPVARSYTFSLGRPGAPLALGIVRNEPVAVLETWRGCTRRIGIPNTTRRVALALLAAGFLLALLVTSHRSQAKRRRSDQR
jgi:hypothetical protein